MAYLIIGGLKEASQSLQTFQCSCPIMKVNADFLNSFLNSGNYVNPAISPCMPLWLIENALIGPYICIPHEQISLGKQIVAYVYLKFSSIQQCIRKKAVWTSCTLTYRLDLVAYMMNVNLIISFLFPL